MDCTYVSQTLPDTPFPNSSNLYVNQWNQAFIKFPVPDDIDPSLIVKAQIQICGTAVDNETFMYLMSSNNWNSIDLTYDSINGILNNATLIGAISTLDPNYQSQMSSIDITSYLFSAYNNKVDQLSFYFSTSYMSPSDNILGLTSGWWFLNPTLDPNNLTNLSFPKLILTYKVPSINLVNVGGNNTSFNQSNILLMSGSLAYLQFYVTDAAPNQTYSVDIMMNGQIEASGAGCVCTSSNFVGLSDYLYSNLITTDNNGNWQSADNPGLAYFSTCYPPNNNSALFNSGYLQIELEDQNPLDMILTLDSNSSSCIQIFNYAYCNCDGMSTSIGPDASSKALYAYYKLQMITNSISPQPPYPTLQNYNSKPQNLPADSTQVLNAIDSSTVFYIATHAACYGNQTSFIAPDGITSIDSYDVSTEMRDRQSNNNNAVPFYNFVFIDACESATSYDMA